MLDLLPVKQDLDTKAILKKSIGANRNLATLNATAKIIPNRFILINALTLQEAKDSSEIENIITTHDDLYRATVNAGNIQKEAKEVKHYQDALLTGAKMIKKGILTINHITKIQSIIEQNDAGVRTQAGTKLKNNQTGKIIYTPPQDYNTVVNLLSNLEKYLNESNDLDCLVNMAIIHYQFEAIHPFYDGNGRTGRIINILYLMLNNLLDLPILYLSRYIIKNKTDYYQLLQDTHTSNNWEPWILYMLDGIEQTAKETTIFINKISQLMIKQKNIIRKESSSMYSKDLLEVIFSNPYTKINFLMNNLNISRKTAAKYLHILEKIGLMNEVKLGRDKYFINKQLWHLLKTGIG